MRIQIRPLVSFIWIAAVIMALGGAVAISDRRYARAKAAVAVPAEGTPEHA
ncbi:MAG TPA: cytochrome c-type biogenesis CcmF C-terminal domain-containing protein [Steroidobacteraceae bacterium]|nr:cytochrome c-type biogenesis CcmF C-terminal domain-containing protein [Steroidobacteraceae bacterium]